MLRISSRSRDNHVLLALLSLLLLAGSATAYGQSLGDIARENQEKKAETASTTPPPKVITNRDLPKDPDEYAGPPAVENTAQTPSPASAEADRQAAEQRAAYQRAAEQWRRKILAQENRVANLQARVAHLKASIHLVDPNASYDYSTALALDRYQARQLERLSQLQQQLDQQKRKLEDLQEAARHAGMHTLVYDP